MQYKILRIKLETYKKIRKMFPAYRRESMSDYFERISKLISGVYFV